MRGTVKGMWGIALVAVAILGVGAVSAWQEQGIKAVPLASQPDLIISSFSSSSMTPVVGSTVTLSVTTKNNGTKKSTTSTTRLSTDFSGTSYTIGPLAIGASLTNQSNYTCNSTGNHTFNATADWLGTNLESNELNNKASLTITCVQPDLITQGITTSFLSGNGTNKTYAINVTTKNQGTSSAIGFWDSLDFGDGTAVAKFFVSTTLNPGNTVVHSTTHTFTNVSNGTAVNLTGTADYNNTISESNEANNVLVQQLFP